MSTVSQTHPRTVGEPPIAPVPLRPPRRRRSKLLLLVGVVLSAVCAAGIVWIFDGSGSTLAAVGVASPVRYGQTISESALREVRVHPDPGVDPVPWLQRSQLIGRTAVTDLLPGGIVTRSAVQQEILLDAGQQLVGVGVKPAQVPATPLRPRQPVLMVPSGQAGTGAERWDPVRGTVMRVGDPDSSGMRVVDVVVPSASGPSLATRASTGSVAIVLLGS